MTYRPLRVGLDLCFLDDEPPGSVHAIKSALVALAAEPPADLQLVLLVGSPGDLPAWMAEAFEMNVLPVGGVRHARRAVHHVWLPTAVKQHGIEVLHVATGDAVPEVPVPVVLGIRDLAAIEMPRSYPAVRGAQIRRNLPRAIASAGSIVVPSEFVRERLVERLEVAPDLISVVPWPLPPHAEPAPIDTVRARFGIIGRIILLPSPTVAHKEHVIALRAFQHLADRHKETTLVLTGPTGPNERRVRREVDALGLGDRVVRLERTTAAVRSALFEHAAAVVHPGVYGSFGSSVLEAMACGVPVVVAGTGAAAEVVGEAGAVIPPGDDAQLAIELHRILDDPEWRRRRVHAGLVRASSYTPERTAAALLVAYRSVLVGK